MGSEQVVLAQSTAQAARYELSEQLTVHAVELIVSLSLWFADIYQHKVVASWLFTLLHQKGLC